MKKIIIYGVGGFLTALLLLLLWLVWLVYRPVCWVYDTLDWRIIWVSWRCDTLLGRTELNFHEYARENI